MLKLKRIITDNAFSYDDVEFMDFDSDQNSIGIKKYITDKSLKQIVIRTKDGKTRIITDWMVGVLQIRKTKPKPGLEKFSKLVINGEISYGPVYLIPMNLYSKINVPKVFEHQFSFIADNWLYVCHQSSLIEMTL